MKRILFALLFVGLGIVGAEAACPANFAVMKDNAASTFNMGLLSDPNGNCQSYVAPTQGGSALSATNGIFTNLLQGNAVIASGNPLFAQLTAGAAIIGKLGIDQTTPGTTNGVQVNAALPAGTNLIGKTGIDQTTVGTTNGISIAQIGANTVLTGNGVSGTGSQRVNIASDNTAFAVNATLQASSATAIGTVNPTTIGNWGLVASTQNSATPTNSELVNCQFNTSPTTITTGNTSPIQCNNAGAVNVAIVSGGGTGGTASTFGASFPATGTAIGLTNGTNMVAWSATTNYGTAPSAIAVPAVNAFITNTNANGSTTSSASSPVVIASDQAAVAVKAASGSIASGAIAAGAQVDLLTMRGTVAAGTAAANSILVGATFNSTAPTLTTGQQASVQVSSRGGLLLGNGYPAGSTPITISATGTTGATTATLATGASVTTYLCGFSIRANAAAAATGNATVTGTITGTLNFTQWTAPNASGLGVTEEIFQPCTPASAVNTGIAVISAAPGTSGVVSVTAWGYTL